MKTYATGNNISPLIKCLISIIVLLPLLFISCPAPGSGGGPTNHYFNGTFRDAATGDPLSGVTIAYASFAPVTTGADGKFSFDLGTGGGAITGPLTVSGGGMQTIYADNIKCNANITDNVTYYATITGTKPTHEVKITVTDSLTGEISNGTSCNFFIFNSNGGMYLVTAAYTTGGFQITTPAFGSDCLVAVTNNTGPIFVAMSRQVDLSAASTDVAVTQDNSPAASKTLIVTGDEVGNYAAFEFSTPYGEFAADTSFTLSGSPATASISFSNPYNYNVQWVQMQVISNYLGSGATKAFSSMGLPTAVTANVTLPAIVTTLGPTNIPPTPSVAYDAGTRTLSVTAYTGADFYEFTLYDSTSGTTAASILSKSNSIVIPTALAAQLSGRSLTVLAYPLGSATGLTIDFLCTFYSNYSCLTELRQVAGLTGSPSAVLTF